MDADEFERAQDARLAPWMPEHLTCIMYRGEPITLARPHDARAYSAQYQVAVGAARAAIMTASWTSACAVKADRNAR